MRELLSNSGLYSKVIVIIIIIIIVLQWLNHHHHHHRNNHHHHRNNHHHHRNNHRNYHLFIFRSLQSMCRSCCRKMRSNWKLAKNYFSKSCDKKNYFIYQHSDLINIENYLFHAAKRGGEIFDTKLNSSSLEFGFPLKIQFRPPVELYFL